MSPSDGPAQLLYAFEAVIIGGLGSIWGAFLGSSVLRISEAVGFQDRSWLGRACRPCCVPGGAGHSAARPHEQGLTMSADQAVFEVGRAQRTKPSKVSVQRQTVSSRIALALCALAIVVMAAMPWWADSGTIRRVVEFSCYLAIAQMWNLLAGYSGLVSVGPQAFIGAGGYALYVLALKFGINPFLAVGLSVVLPTLLAVPTYAVLHRLDGPYFAIGTWVVAEAVRLLTTNLDYVNNGAGLTLRVMSRYSAHEREVGMIFLCVILLLTTVGGLLWLLRSRYGLALTAMRDNPIAAESQGVDVQRLRFIVFVLAAAGSGLAGAIYYMAQLRITPASGFNPQWASVCISTTMVGGALAQSRADHRRPDLLHRRSDSSPIRRDLHDRARGRHGVGRAAYARGEYQLICRFGDAPWRSRSAASSCVRPISRAAFGRSPPSSLDEACQ